MGVFSKVFKHKDAASTKSQTRTARDGPKAVAVPKPKWADAWTRKDVGADEVQELLQVCTQELKSRALDMPFLLLPFRPDSDANGARTFIRNFFSTEHGTSSQYHGQGLYQELKIIEPMVLCSIMKWCWSRLDGGVVGWNTYELFRQGEQESQMAKHSFDTFIPLSVDSDARKRIIFDFFELLAAIAANGKTNGLGGRKLSRLAGWWAFNHLDNGKGFEGGYRSWSQAADATSHLFFAYLRSLAPETTIDSTVSKLPRSLQALLAQTEYPPETPYFLVSPNSKVVMLVSTVSPTPFALLRRAKNFDYKDDNPALQAFSEYEDPVMALTAECRRVVEAISSTNSTTRAMPELTLSAPSTQADASWSRFEDMGFSSLLDAPEQNGHVRQSSYGKSGRISGIRSSGTSAVNGSGRPQTPSWADFLSSGFADDSSDRAPRTFLMSPDQQLPPLGSNRVQSSQSHVKGLRDDNLEPGELASVTHIDLDETFWWVWMSSLAGEEPPARKAVFGRCALVETHIDGARWLVLEEQIKSAASMPMSGAFVAEKKGRFSTFTKRGRGRRESTGQAPPVPRNPYQGNGMAVPESRTTIRPDQQTKVQQAAQALVQKRKDEAEEEHQTARKRGRTNEQDDHKTQSAMSLQPVIMTEAGPAMQWARKFDKESIRQQYLGDSLAAKGNFGRHTPNASTGNLVTALSAGDATRLAQGRGIEERDLPLTPSGPEPPAKDDSYAPAAKDDTYAPAAPENSSMDFVQSLQDQKSGPVETEAAPPVEPQALAGSKSTFSNEAPAQKILRKPVNSVDLKNDEQNALRESQAPDSHGIPPETPTQASADEVNHDEHPALRDSPSVVTSPVSQRTPSTPTKSPAVIAAAAAALAATNAARNSESTQSSSKTATPSTSPKASRKASTRGFRSMFNRRKPQAPEEMAAQRAMNGSKGSTLSAEKVPAGRSSSLPRRKGASPATDTVDSASRSAAPFEKPVNSQATTDLSNMDGGEPGPEVTTDPGSQQPTHDEEARGFVSPAPAFTRNANDSSARFSNFTQGAEEAPTSPTDFNNSAEPNEIASSHPPAPTTAPPPAPVAAPPAAPTAASPTTRNAPVLARLPVRPAEQTPAPAAKPLRSPQSQSAYQARLAALSAASGAPVQAAPSAFSTRLAALIAPEQQVPPTRTAPTAPERPAPAARSESAMPPSSEFRTPMETPGATNPLDTTKAADSRYSFDSRDPEEITSPPSQAPRQAAQPTTRAAPVAAAPTQVTPISPALDTADRWAQIRKNAAERRTSESSDPKGIEGQGQAKPQSAHSGKTDEDETSGEETIESRVARIKARVAELTSAKPTVSEVQPLRPSL